MSTSASFNLALELAVKVTGWENLATLVSKVLQMSDYAYLCLLANRSYERIGAVGKGCRIEVRSSFSAMPAA